MFVLPISAWYLLRGCNVQFARRSMTVAASFGLAAAQGRVFASIDGSQDAPPQFARYVYDLLTPGVTLMVTDEKLGSGTHLPSTVRQAGTALGAPEPEPADSDGERRETPKTTP